MEQPRARGRTLVVLSAALVLLAVAAALFLPTRFEDAFVERDDLGTVEVRSGSTTLWGEIRDGDEGRSVLGVLLLPALVAFGAVALDLTRARRASRMGAAVVLSAFALLALASVGLFFLPGAGAMLVAALRS